MFEEPSKDKENSKEEKEEFLGQENVPSSSTAPLEERFLVRPTEVSPENFNFIVIKPKKYKWIYVFFLVILLNIVFFRAFNALGFFLLLLISYVAAKMWAKSYNLIIRGFLLPSLKQWKKIKAGTTTRSKITRFYRLMLYLLGLRIDPSYDYFLEAKSEVLDLSSVTKVFKNKYVDLVSASAGISFLIAVGMDALIHNPKASFFIAVIAMVISPILVFWIVPVIWILEDGQVRSIDDKNTVSHLAENVRHGVLNKLLGIGGFLVGYGFLTSRSEELWGAVNEGIVQSISISVFSVLILLLLIFSVAGTAYLVAMLYLTKYHEDFVNQFRKEVSSIIPVGVTIVKLVETPISPPEELTGSSLEE